MLSGSSPADRWEHRASCRQCGEPGQTQVFPQEGCKDGCYSEGKPELRLALSVTCRVSTLSSAFSWLRVAHPLPPPPLCYRRRGSRYSSRCWCLLGSPSFLRLHCGSCRNCGRRTRSPEYGHVHLDCQERAGWGDLFQGSTMAFPARVRSNYLTPLSVRAIEKCSSKGQNHKSSGGWGYSWWCEIFGYRTAGWGRQEQRGQALLGAVPASPDMEQGCSMIPRLQKPGFPSFLLGPIIADCTPVQPMS